MSGKPLCIDLFCGLGGWTDGFLAEGFSVIGFDVEQHVYGEHRYPAQLVLQDVRTLHGSQFKGATMIVASSPCQEFSYRAMPWKRAKALGPPELGMELFAQAGRIQREACEAAGRYIPMIQENVKGAQKYVGRAQWHYGSFYLWGDVPALMPMTTRATKNSGGSWFNVGSPGQRVVNRNPVHDGVKAGKANADAAMMSNWGRDDGVKHHASGAAWFNGAPDKMLGHDGPAKYGSKSKARKAASARIAKIPFALARYIAQVARETAHREAA